MLTKGLAVEKIKLNEQKMNTRYKYRSTMPREVGMRA